MSETPRLAKASSAASDVSTTYKEDIALRSNQAPDLDMIKESDLEGANMDDDAKALRGQKFDWTTEEENRVKRRIDWHL